MRAGNGMSEPQEGPQAQVVAVEGLSQGTQPGAGSGRRDALLPVPGPPTARAVPVPQKLPCLAKATGRRPSTPAPRPAPGRRRAARPRSWRPRGVSWLRLRGPCWPDRHTREELLAVIQWRRGPIRAAADASSPSRPRWPPAGRALQGGRRTPGRGWLVPGARAPQAPSVSGRTRWGRQWPDLPALGKVTAGPPVRGRAAATPGHGAAFSAGQLRPHE